MNYKALTNTAVNLTNTPFAPGFNGVVHNNSAGALVVQGSEDGTTYADLATVGIDGYANVKLYAYMKVKTAGTLHLLA